MSYGHTAASRLFNNLFSNIRNDTNLHKQHMSYGHDFPLRKYWGILPFGEIGQKYTGHQEEMVLLLNEVIGVSDDD